MWQTAAGFTLLGLVLGSYETWAIRYHNDWTITELTRRNAHLMLILTAVVFTLLGFALGWRFS